MKLRTLSDDRLKSFRRALLEWYDRNKRELPWRKTGDPYRVWVSEIMLQQTRVAAVLPRYEKFFRRFPTVQKLAAARPASVLAEWSGLGYYRRARNMHAAAKLIVRQQCRQLPEISMIARVAGNRSVYRSSDRQHCLREPTAVVDGNVERVVSAFTCPHDHSWSAAQQLLDPCGPAILIRR